MLLWNRKRLQQVSSSQQQSEAVKSSQKQSQAVRSSQRQSKAVRSSQKQLYKQSKAIKSSQTQSEAVKSSQKQSLIAAFAVRSSQKQSEAVKSSQKQSKAVRSSQKERAASLLKVLFPPDDDKYFRWEDECGVSQEHRLLDETRRYLDIIDLENHLVHWCFVEEDDECYDEDGRRLKVGDPCCPSRDVAVKKCATGSVSYLFGRAWALAVLSRWLHESYLSKKFVIGSLGYRLLPRTLSRLMATWDVDASMETCLAKLIAADENDFSSKNKLRLLRICNQLCPLEAAQEIAERLCCNRVLDALLYEILGANRKRCTLFDLADPKRSPFLKCVERLANLLENWRSDCDGWRLIWALGVDFASAPARLTARRQIIQFACGMEDQFLIRFSLPPYSWQPVADPTVASDVRGHVADDALAQPSRCLSTFCQRILARCPTRASFLLEAPRPVWLLLKGHTHSVDDLERSHAQVRTDLSSSGPAKSIVDSANRVLCRAVQSEHVARGGVPVAKATQCIADSIKPSRSQSMALCDLEHAGEVVSARVATTNRHPGSSLIHLRNRKVHAFKSVHCSDRPMTKDEIASCEDEARKEYAIVRRDSDAWKRVSMCTRSLKLAKESSIPVANDATNKPFQPLWGASSDARCILSPAMMAKQMQQSVGHGSSGMPMLVPDGVDDPFLEEGADSKMDASRVLGCLNMKKNVCRLHADDGAWVRMLDALTKLLSKAVDELTASVVEACDGMLWLQDMQHFGEDGFEVAGPSNRKCNDTIVVLGDARYKPKMQYYVRCHLLNSKAQRYRLPAFPFTTKMMVGTARFGEKNH